MPTPEETDEAAAAEPADGKHSRFAINNLINRMTGHAREEKPAPRQQPSIRATSSQGEPALDYEREEQERVDIPAFLRRQAN